MISSVSYPNQHRNYCVFDDSRIYKKKNINTIRTTLEKPNSEEEVLECLYALNLMLDEDNKYIDEAKNIYPSLSKYNQTKNPNIQAFLAGIYRKTKIPDGFGPLCAMLIQNSINPPQNCYFDPNEEIGGAILDYLA